MIDKEAEKILKTLNINTQEDIMEIMDIILPEANLDEDNDGAIIIYTNITNVGPAVKNELNALLGRKE